jgi:hypothetical protein
VFLARIKVEERGSPSGLTLNGDARKIEVVVLS